MTPLLEWYFAQTRDYPRLTLSEECELGKQCAQGDSKARERLITSNLRLVVKIASHYKSCGLPLEDLISEGTMGLIHAVDKYQPQSTMHSKGKFSIYAGWWIKQAIQRAIWKSQAVRIPQEVLRWTYLLFRAQSRLHGELGREPTQEELVTDTRAPAKVVADFLSNRFQTVSLDAPLGEDACLRDVIPAPEADPATEGDAQMHRLVMPLLAELDIRTQVIIKRHFGLEGNAPQHQNEIVKDLKISRQRISQLEIAGLRKLKQKLLFSLAKDGQWNEYRELRS